MNVWVVCVLNKYLSELVLNTYNDDTINDTGKAIKVHSVN